MTLQSLSAGAARKPLVITVAIFAALGVLAFVWMPLNALLRDFSCDDSFYYSGIARELATSGASSFDGVTKTNGYHPLWTWLEVPIFWLFEDAVTAIRATRILEVLLAVVAVAAWCTALRRGGVSLAAGSVLTLFFLKTRVLYIGMDAGVSLCVLGLASWATVRLLQDEPRKRWPLALAAGVLLALTPLGRLDNLAFSAAVTGWLVIARKRLGLDRRTLLIVIMPQVITIAAYAYWNWIAFDTALPISGQMKQWWSHNTPDEGFARFWRRLTELWAAKPIRDGVVFGVISLAIVWWRARRTELMRAFVPVVIGLCALAIGKMLYYSATVEPVYAKYSWYFATGLATRYLAVALIIDSLLRWLAPRFVDGRMATVVAVVMLLVVGGREQLKWRSYTLGTKPDWEMLSYGGAQWLAANVPHNARVASFDAGVLGYFAKQRVTNLDGLVNSHAFLLARRRGDPLSDYIRQEGIDYVINVVPNVEMFRTKGLGVGMDQDFVVIHRGEETGFIDGRERRILVLQRRR